MGRPVRGGRGEYSKVYRVSLVLESVVAAARANATERKSTDRLPVDTNMGGPGALPSDTLARAARPPCEGRRLAAWQRRSRLESVARSFRQVIERADEVLACETAWVEQTR